MARESRTRSTKTTTVVIPAAFIPHNSSFEIGACFAFTPSLRILVETVVRGLIGDAIQRARQTFGAKWFQTYQGEGLDPLLWKSWCGQAHSSRLSWSKRDPYGNLQRHTEGCRSEIKIGRDVVIDLKYSLVIEATEDPTFFGFYSPDLEGFTGIGHSIEDCLYQARWGMEEHIELLKEQSLPVPKENPDPKIVIQNQESLAKAS